MHTHRNDGTAGKNLRLFYFKFMVTTQRALATES